MNILMVDDEPIELEQLEFLIKPMIPLWNLYTAIDSIQALELSKSIDFQLAFVDIELPGKSGLELAKELKKVNEQLVIIILTAHQDFEYAKQSIKIGVSEYLTKPIIKDELKNVLEHHTNDIQTKEYSPMILKTLNMIHKSYKDKINLEDVANHIHVNISYLSRKFKAETDTSFSEYLTKFRIEMAKTLLLSHNRYSISDVAEKTGFNSLHYFSSSFRKQVGMSPKQYQEMKL
ncbi:AraC family transcriptional regulator [Virgibacillus byunsanensis]|uniref:AraC family transcriptional regulator n=1 Tax=Virgibacillus byunsanensis TaxID=570945 RepID=A0ABW3LHY4_9BACI